MLERIRRWFVGETPTVRHELDEREREAIEQLARVSRRTPAEVRNEARRRALRYEIDSMRHR